MLNRCASLGERTCQTTSPQGQEVVRKEVQSLRDDWASFSTALADIESNLESCVANWMKLDDEQTGFIEWLDRMDSKVKAYLEPSASLAHKRQHLEDGEVTFHVISIMDSEEDFVMFGLCI